MDVKKGIDVLINAEKTNKPISFMSEDLQLTEDECYQMQRDLIEQKKAEFNNKLAGYKISMTSPDTQAIANTYEPAYGTYLDYNIQKETQVVNLNELLEPLLEPEIVFYLNEDLSSEADHLEIIQKSTIYLGTEIPDSRYSNWFPNFNLTDLLCDNAFAGRLVLSEVKFPATEVEFENISLNLYHEDNLIAKGSSTNVLDNPLNSVIWLNKKVISHRGSLTKGLFISSGTFTAPVKLSEGTYTLEFSGLDTMKVQVK